MSQRKNPDDGVSLSDGRTGPAVESDTPSPNEPESNSIIAGLIPVVKSHYSQVTTKLQIPLSLIIAIIVTYLMMISFIAYLISPYNAFGMLSATTGIIILGVLHHPSGVISPSTKYQKYIYPASGIAFIFVGLRYLLMGVIFSYPFS